MRSQAPPHGSRRRPAAAVVALLVLAFVLGGCGSDSDEESEARAGAVADWAPLIETGADDAVTGLDFTDVPDPGPELLVETVTEGDGPAVESGQAIQVDYFGAVYNTDEPFDSSFGGQPFTTQIGVGAVIRGWDQALVGVPVGSRVIMSIPPDLGYGEAGAPPQIPAGSTLFFVVDVLRVR